MEGESGFLFATRLFHPEVVLECLCGRCAIILWASYFLGEAGYCAVGEFGGLGWTRFNYIAVKWLSGDLLCLLLLITAGV